MDTLKHGNPYTWITVTDGNGNDFHAETPDAHAPDGDVKAWTRIEGDNGFGQPSGAVVLLTGLKKLGDGSGKYGA